MKFAPIVPLIKPSQRLLAPHLQYTALVKKAPAHHLGAAVKTAQAPPIARSRPTTAYVTRLLVSLLRSESGELIIREPDTLPGYPHADAQSGDGFRRVTNRLKIMAGLTPMRYPKPVSGSTTFFVGGREATASLEFHDADAPPWFRVHCTFTGQTRESRT